MNELTLTANELFYMGHLMNAKYIDYSYISAVDVVGQSEHSLYALYGSGLLEKGYIDEDFDGKVTVTPQAEKRLAPVFFGEEEASISLFARGTTHAEQCFNLHALDGEMVHACLHDDTITIVSITSDELSAVIENLNPTALAASADDADKSLPSKEVEAVISVKWMHIGKESETCVFTESHGVILGEDEEGNLIEITLEHFRNRVKCVLMKIAH